MLSSPKPRAQPAASHASTPLSDTNSSSYNGTLRAGIAKVVEFLQRNRNQGASPIRIEYEGKNIKKITIKTGGSVKKQDSLPFINPEVVLANGAAAVFDLAAQHRMHECCPGFSIRNSSLEVEYSHETGEIQWVAFEIGEINGVSEESRPYLLRFFHRAAVEMHYNTLLLSLKAKPVKSIRIPFSIVTPPN